MSWLALRRLEHLQLVCEALLWERFWSQVAICALLTAYHIQGGRDPNLVGGDY